MFLRSSILAGVAAIAFAGFVQAADMPSSQTTPTTPATSTEMPGPAPAATGINLNDVQSPKTTLRGASVKDSKGDAVGEVKSVQLAADGKVAAVNVKVGTKTVALKAETLTYMQADNTLISTQTKAEIQAH